MTAAKQRAEQMEAFTKEIGFNLIDTATFAEGHPHAKYDLLRERFPVLRHPGSEKRPPFWVLTRYEDIRALSLDATNFTSTKGFRVDTDNRASMDPEIGHILSRFMLAMDRPEHDDFRGIVSSAFMPSGMRAVEPKVANSVAELMKSLDGLDEVEFVTQVGAIVPIRTVCTILGVPPEDEWRVFNFTNAVFGTDDPEYAPSLEDANRNYLDIFEYGRWLLAERRREPKDDLLTLIVNGKAGGRPITEDEQLSFFSNMVAAGNETTRSSLSGAIWALSQFRDERQRLIDDPSLIPNAVNEILRWFSPVIQMARTATKDVEIGGEHIREGERVAMLYGAGNHDPAVFADPHRLDVTRSNAIRNITFGYGIHSCLGSRLAILQLRLILEAFLAKFPNYEVTGKPTFIASNFVAPMKTLPVKLNRQ